ncbi:hypothetical protein LTR37_014009 [Vermiconidia calcicola]|uniref:Uncharacterized protein n=1 Tax=Vermiconidia calcicola TaxID=1690605 RepID=A0ACC3MVG0_9PEZI|nr:hypothetical protein LTR37_014009 [Vermiconidia calcicola]
MSLTTTQASSKDRFTSCRFLALPPELRVRIYDYYFGARKHYFLDVNENGVGGRWCKDNYEADIALLYACREVYAEASPILFKTIRFMVDISPGVEPEYLASTTKFLGTLDQCVFVNHIQHLNLSIWAAVNDCHFVKVLDLRLNLWSTVPAETARAIVKTLTKVDCRGRVGVHLKSDELRGTSESLLQALRRKGINVEITETRRV